MARISDLSPQSIAQALGGKVGSGGWINVPAPGHSAQDASLGIMPDADAPQGFRVNPRGGQDPIAMRDYVSSHLDLDPWQPTPTQRRDGGNADMPTHGKLGTPDALFWYQHADGSPSFAVARYEARDGKKKTFLQVQRLPDGQWLWKGIKGAKPLYHLTRILAHPSRQVLVVEGEKKCDAAQALLPGLCITSFSGGNSAHEGTDMSPLDGRSVILWPDNDTVGINAMQAVAARIASQNVKVIDPSEMPAKWDIGNAVEEGWDADRIIAWAKEHAKPRTTNVVPLRAVPAPDTNWKANLVYNENGAPKPRVTNNFRWFLARHPAVAGCWEWDEMTQRVMCARAAPWDGPAWRRHPAGDEDVTQALYWLERAGLAPRPSEVRVALVTAARDVSRHPIREYLGALTWDQVPRLVALPANHFGTDPLPIYGIFFQRWMISAVARIMVPGCKADCILVLEGAQERMKSTVLKVLATVGGVVYFTDSMHDIETKDGAINLQGIWIVEIAELNAFQRKDADAVKSWLSRSSDRYRVPWGSVAEDFPRQCVIAGTLNPSGSGYLRDPTGARRFWPIPVKRAIDISAIEAIRDQLWAEAVHLYRAGFKWHLSEEEVITARGITEERYEDDPWAEIIEAFLIGKTTCTTNQICLSALTLFHKDLSKATSRRVNDHLRRMGWVQKTARVDGKYEKVWSKP